MNLKDPYAEPEEKKDILPEEDTTDYSDQKPILFYHTRHMMGFEELKSATELYGDEYVITWKALWYQVMSYRIRTANIQLGRIKVDGRISALYPIKAGHGKGELKRTIKGFTEYFMGRYGEPTSLHAEQLVGKTVKKRGKDEYEQRQGYLSDDWLVIDEAYEFLSSTELHYSEARKYLRVALDRYPGNILHKRATEIGKVAPLEYEPICPASIFIQQKKFKDDRLILEGDLRRLIIPYVNMAGVDKTEAYLQNIYEEEPESDALLKFCETVESLPRYETFTITNDARNTFAELFLDLLKYAKNYNPKIRSYSEIVGFTLQGHLLKMCAVQALQSGTNEIQAYHVELAYMDLFELMHHNYQFINNKIPGFLNYGEGWQGAEALDQELLAWLYEKKATSYDSAILGVEYLQEIMRRYHVRERRARDIMKIQRERGWIKVKQVQHGSRVWLDFVPDFSRMPQNAECNGLKSRGALGEEKIHNQISNNNYKYFNINYLELLDLLNNPPAFCNLEQSTTHTNPREDQIIHEPPLETTNTTTRCQDSRTSIMETPGTIQVEPITDRGTYEAALKGAFQAFCQNSHWTGWTYTLPFLDRLESTTGIEDPNSLYQIKSRMIQDGYIQQKGPQSEIRASKSFIKLIKVRGWDNGIITSE